MKIITINVPESYIDAINKLIGEDGPYPSRSELIRVAVREFLIKEFSNANKRKEFEKKMDEMVSKSKKMKTKKDKKFSDPVDFYDFSNLKRRK